VALDLVADADAAVAGIDSARGVAGVIGAAPVGAADAAVAAADARVALVYCSRVNGRAGPGKLPFGVVATPGGSRSRVGAAHPALWGHFSRN
jgi:hypothetical protein